MWIMGNICKLKVECELTVTLRMSYLCVAACLSVKQMAVVWMTVG